MKKYLCATVFTLLSTPLVVAEPLPDLTELELAVRNLLPAAQQKAVAEKPDSLRRFINDYVGMRQLAERARDQGLDRQPAVAIRLQHQANQLLTQQLVEAELASMPKPDMADVARETYLLHPERFQQQEQVHARHILLTKSDNESPEQFRQRAQELSNKLVKNSKRFTELAMQLSKDPSVAANSGDLGFFSREQMVKSFADAAFSLKKGAISEPVESRFGYHVIQVLDKKEAQKLSFDEVRDLLIAEAEAEHEKNMRQEVIARLRAETELKIEDVEIERLQQLLRIK